MTFDLWVNLDHDSIDQFRLEPKFYIFPTRVLNTQGFGLTCQLKEVASVAFQRQTSSVQTYGQMVDHLLYIQPENMTMKSQFSSSASARNKNEI